MSVSTFTAVFPNSNSSTDNPIASISITGSFASAPSALAAALSSAWVDEVLSLSNSFLANVNQGVGPMASVLPISIAGTTFSGYMLPVTASLLRVSVPNATGAVSFSLPSGLVDGQSLTVAVIETNAGCTSLTVAGFTMAATTGQLNTSAGINPSQEGSPATGSGTPLNPIPIFVTFTWSAEQATWIVQKQGAYT
jgi:hypothetical protein